MEEDFKEQRLQKFLREYPDTTFARQFNRKNVENPKGEISKSTMMFLKTQTLKEEKKKKRGLPQSPLPGFTKKRKHY